MISDPAELTEPDRGYVGLSDGPTIKADVVKVGII